MKTASLRSGFTVLELLIATVLLAALLAGVFSLTRSTLLFTGLTRAVSTSIEDIADAEGYIADALRNAKAVYGALELALPGEPNLVCDLADDGRCIAVLAPVLGGSDVGFAITNFDLSVFAVVEDGDLYEDRGLSSSRGGVPKISLVEYRVENVCAGGCTSVEEYTLPATPITVTLPTGFLVGDLSLVAPSAGGGSSTPVEVFSVPAGVDDTLQVTLVVQADARAAQPFVVRQTPVALQVAVRGLLGEEPQ